MAITTKFGQAVIGSAVEDAAETLTHIHRPEINLVSAYRPQDPAIEKYLRGLDIERRYMQPTEEDPMPYRGIEPGVFYYSARTGDFSIDSSLPQDEGRDVFLEHVKLGAMFYSDTTGFNDVQVMLRLLGQSNTGLFFHVDNAVTFRGLETILGANRTLWLPDQYADWNQFECSYDSRGEMNGNILHTNFNDHARAEQVDHHHMSIHKGSAFANPLLHAAAANCVTINMHPGTRAIVTYDRAFVRD